MSKSEDPGTPMVGSFPACRALAASGHAAAPLSSVMNSRRFIRQPRWQAVGDVRAYRRIARLAAAGVLHCGISTRLMTASGQTAPFGDVALSPFDSQLRTLIGAARRSVSS